MNLAEGWTSPTEIHLFGIKLRKATSTAKQSVAMYHLFLISTSVVNLLPLLQFTQGAIASIEENRQVASLTLGVKGLRSTRDL